MQDNTEKLSPAEKRLRFQQFGKTAPAAPLRLSDALPVTLAVPAKVAIHPLLMAQSLGLNVRR